MSESVLSNDAEVSYLTMVSLRRLLSIGGIKRYRDSAESRHRLSMTLFPKELGTGSRSTINVLFRGERSTKESIVLIRSKIAPSNIPGVNTIKEDFSKFKKGQTVRFRVTVSPIVRSGSKERFLSDFDEIENWIAKRLTPSLSDIQVVSSKSEELQRGKSKNFVKLEQIDGVAKVDDVNSLVESLISGVGRNKSYGAGLLTVALI